MAVKLSIRQKWLIGIFTAFVLYTITGFLIVPAVIKSQMLKRIPALTQRQVSVEEVRVNPYVLSLTIHGFALKESTGETFSSFDEFYANFQLSSLFKRSWVFKEVTLKKPFAQITYKQDGTFNFADLLANTNFVASPTSASPQPPRVLIGQLCITNGALSFTDLTRKEPFHSQFRPIDVNLTNLTTIRDKNSPYSFLARTDSGEIFAWSGRVSVNPIASSGTFRISGIKLGKYAPYSQDYARFQITDGVVDFAADYSYDSSTNALDLTINHGTLYLQNLELKSPDSSETVVKISDLSVEQADASLFKHSARIGSIKSTGGSILARQNQDGSINLLSSLNLSTNSPSADVSTNSILAAPWSAVIDEIAFKNYAIKLEDRKPAQPATFNLDKLTFTLKNVSNIPNAPVKTSVALRFQETGSITVDGTVTLLPLSADLQLSLTYLDLRPFQPYLHEQAALQITGGALDLNGHASYARPETNAPKIAFTGELAISNFATADDVLFKDFAKWDALNVTGIKASLQPDDFQVDQVKFAGLNTSLIIGPDKRPNLQTILRRDFSGSNILAGATKGANGPFIATSSQSLPKLALRELAFENGSIHFIDQSIEPHCDFSIKEFGGDIRNLSLQQDITAAVNITGKVDDHAPFTMTGTVKPLLDDPLVDLTITFKDTELTAFTPYMEKYAGYPLNKGKFSYNAHYSILKKELKAENGVHIDQLTLGPKNQSPDATHLPVKLAVALLKDRNGLIALDLPVHGRIDDPKFKVGPVILQVVVNLLTKAAVSPFALLGSMFGAGEELSYVDFQPGQSNFTEPEIKKLDTLARALYERPALNLEIAGSVNPTNDTPALAKFKLEQQLKSAWVKEQTDAGKTAVAIEEVKLETSDYDRLLKQLYTQTFPPPANAPVADVPLTNVPVAQTIIVTNPPPLVEPQPVAYIWNGLTVRGATRLFGWEKPAVAIAKVTTPEPSIVAPSVVTNQPVITLADTGVSAAIPEPELQPAEMETALLGKIEISENDLRNLMQQRARAVQDYLLKTEKVTAERLFLIAPKPLGSFKGENRVNLSLN